MSAPLIPKHVVLIEPRLVDEFGHFVTQLDTLTRAFRAMGASVTVVGDVRLQFGVRERLRAAGATVWSRLRCAGWESLRARAVVWPIIARQFTADLRALAQHIPPDALVVMPSSELDVLQGLANAIHSGCWQHRTVAQLFYWDRRAADAKVKVFESALSRIVKRDVRAAMGKGLIIAGHSAPIARALERVLSMPVPDVPLAVHWPDRALGERSASRPVLGMLGGLRDEKGFAQFAKALPTLHSSPRVVVQAAPHALANESARQSLIRAVEARDGEVHIAPLSAADYGDLLRKVDVCVCPYVPERYAERTSGVVIEALGLGAVPVVPEGTWLAEFVREAGVGEVYAPYTASALAAAIDRVVSDWDGRRAEAAQIAKRARDDHSPAAVVRRLVEISNG
ncbi:MAG: hypothetical protein ACJA1R_002308 [Flavobacteriales bacterium]